MAQSGAVLILAPGKVWGMSRGMPGGAVESCPYLTACLECGREPSLRLTRSETFGKVLEPFR